MEALLIGPILHFSIVFTVQNNHNVNDIICALDVYTVRFQ